MKITIEREGSFPVGWKHSHDHQCGEYGTSILHFRVKIEGSTEHLNKKGWIIDNNEITNYFETKYADVYDFQSCEHISAQACRDLEKIVKAGGSHVNLITVSTSGIPRSWITAELHCSPFA